MAGVWHCLQALQGSVLNDKPLKIHIHELLSKERSAELAAANAAKSQKTPQKQTQQQQEQQQAEGSAGEEKPTSQTATRRQQGSRQTFSVKVINLAWSTTAEGLRQHFADCPVSCLLFALQGRLFMRCIAQHHDMHCAMIDD